MRNIDSLPVEIILDILKRLHIDSVIHDRLVARRWNYLVYHRLLDYLKETQVELERKLKEIKSQIDPELSFCFRIPEEIMGFIKQGIIDSQKNSGGLFEIGKLLLLKNLMDTDLKCCLICLHSEEFCDVFDAILRVYFRKQYIVKKLKQPQITYFASGKFLSDVSLSTEFVQVNPKTKHKFDFDIVHWANRNRGVPVLPRAWRVNYFLFFLLFILFLFVAAGATTVTK